MKYEEYMEVFKTDNNGCFINLIIPKEFDGKELNLIGRNQLSLSIDEIVKSKQYAHCLFYKVEWRDTKVSHTLLYSIFIK